MGGGGGGVSIQYTDAKGREKIWPAKRNSRDNHALLAHTSGKRSCKSDHYTLYVILLTKYGPSLVFYPLI